MSWLEEITDPDKFQKHVEQGSEQWDNIRCGRFTSSEWHLLTGHGWRAMTDKELSERPKKGKGSATTRVPDYNKLSDGANGYIDRKVAEVLTGQPRRQAYAYPLVYGKEQEPYACELFQERTGMTCHETGFHTFTDHAGGTPDRLVEEEDGLEIKSPYNSENQLDYLMLLHVNDIRDRYPQFYWQCVTLLLFTGKKRWHFCTFDPRFKDEKLRLTHLIFEADKLQDEFDLIVKTLENAIEKKLQRIQGIQKLIS